jgi:CBS domain-containing protein
MKDEITPLRSERITMRAGWRHAWSVDASVPVCDCMEGDLRYLRPNMWADRAVKYMWEAGVSELPVLDDRGAPVGIVYLVDLLAAADPEPPAGAPDRPRNVLAALQGSLGSYTDGSARARVKDIMMEPAPTVSDDIPVARAAARMLHTGRERLVVVDSDGLAVGSISVTNVMQWLVERTDSRESRAVRGELVGGRTPVMRDLMRLTVAVPRDVPIRQARALLKAYGLETLPVVENGGLVGVVAGPTLDLFVGDHGDDSEEWVENIPVEAVMTTPPPVCAPDEPVEHLADRLTPGSGSSIFVMEEGRLIGVVSASDLPTANPSVRRGR